MSTATRPSRASRTWARRTWTYLCGHWELYLFLLPGLVFAMMFRLLPMSKIVIAFKNFKPLKGIAASPWVGFAQFEKMFADPDVLNVIKNYEVVDKRTIDTPDELHGIVKCNNPKCITNNEPMSTFFTIVDKSKGILKCHYCDKEQDMNKVELV